ncbi:hypothetical protein [Halarcobacter anaerophilus]|uniref:Uncharacterized protein n=1 Tax=Halarcobacter anaerophilus TaxID=877500 RepID=A0A4Q0Y1Q7_9BACT|nr:hypothetical protein [Halarcobacter anaerophilus]QDF28958.1 hypothetical protein AANAER_1478 [Halarcobacter anaerophilus]RXJ63593.1 hypothetical protein CRV06_05215 [Halarcobacter anaerophilus]
MTKKMITSKKPYPLRKEVVEDLSTLDDGIHQMWDEQDRLYQGIVKDKKVLFFVTPLGVVYQDNGFTKDLEQEFKEVGGLSSPDDFKTIAKFNKWI